MLGCIDKLGLLICARLGFLVHVARCIMMQNLMEFKYIIGTDMIITLRFLCEFKRLTMAHKLVKLNIIVDT